MRRMPRPLALSIADWLVPWRERAWPIDWSAEFGRAAPLALEIGFGNGEYLEREARRRPERNHLGIELSWTSATHLFRRLDHGGLPHVRALLADAEAALQRLFAPGSLTEVFVNHPCPWPKERHAERRLVRPEVLALLADRMAPGAPLLIVTDHAPYAAEIGAALEAQRAFAPARGATEVGALPGREPTKYQRKAMAAGVPIHYFPWRRAGAVPAPLPPEPSSTDAMPSLTLAGEPAEHELFRGFAPVLERAAPRGVETVVKLGHAYRSLDEQAWLVEAMVKEDRLQQDCAVLVVRRAGGETLVKLSGLGHPHPTFGVKRAVWSVGAWLRQRHPELSLAGHNLGDAAEAG
jgi:tRNA (guanine-N7-)-methyltransferase